MNNTETGHTDNILDILHHVDNTKCQEMGTSSKYTEEHEVMLLLKRIPPCVPDDSDRYLKKMHLDYYKALKKSNRVLSYGMALTGDSICILLHVFSDNDFENIILNDPALDKIYEIVSIVPFARLL